MDIQEPSMDQALLDRIKSTVLENLANEQFSVEELSHEIGMSRSYLHRKLKLLQGKSVSQYIREVRLAEAMKLLKKDVATVSEIAYRVGFNSPSYFNKTFQKFYGFPPGEYKKGMLPDEALSNEVDKRSIWHHYKWLLVAGVLLIGVMSFYFSYQAVSGTTEASIAVLPFDNLTGQEENDYFVDGFSKALIGELGTISSIRVISNTSSHRYKASQALLPQIASELGVNTVVEGSLLGVGDSVRVLIQVIKVFPLERQVWAHEYSGTIAEIFQIHRDVVHDIAQKIDVGISQDLKKEYRKVNPVTYRAYLRAQYEMEKGTEEAIKAGMDYFYKAIESDPGDPLAYAGLAMGYAYQGHGLSKSDAYDRATTAARKAIRLDPTLDEAHSVMASLYLYSYWDWEIARASFEKALAANPSNAIAHADYAWYHCLFHDKEKALYHAEKATALDPFSPTWHAWLSLLYFIFDETDKAEQAALKALELQEAIPYGLVTLGWVFLEKGQHEKAIKLHEQLPSEGSFWRTFLAETYIKTGQVEKAERLLTELEEAAKVKEINVVHLGIMAANVNQFDKAFRYLNEGLSKKVYPLIYLDFSIFNQQFKQDPRYHTLLEQLNLPKTPLPQ